MKLQLQVSAVKLSASTAIHDQLYLEMFLYVLVEAQQSIFGKYVMNCSDSNTSVRNLSNIAENPSIFISQYMCLCTDLILFCLTLATIFRAAKKNQIKEPLKQQTFEVPGHSLFSVCVC